MRIDPRYLSFLILTVTLSAFALLGADETRLQQSCRVIAPAEACRQW